MRRVNRVTVAAIALSCLGGCGPWDGFQRSIEGEWTICEPTRTGAGECLPTEPTCIEDAYARCAQTRGTHVFDAGGYEATQYVFVYPTDGGCRVTLFEDHSRSGQAVDAKPRAYDCTTLRREGCDQLTGNDCRPR